MAIAPPKPNSPEVRSSDDHRPRIRRALKSSPSWQNYDFMLA
ncbi:MULTISPECIES: hypothetical protein [Limnospira]|uniref:Uncharacterized protein n=1 Tax=Limnospira fusiformis PMC 851.14 TaxID=2219512 RepID=A0ABU9EE04_LIMFS|nr:MULTISPECIES: hypothetical protein [Limnospira]EKD06772.1 hypothetical protein SPLC1_S520060 [Arthrospira platensis C1]MDC0839702.1 hypothetical protein [Limnoraphis robusta]MDT9315788.1 hypothetical protein [Limnospira sp. PMC 1306.21]MDT9320687.1 hypothetical protein [Limnospira sp. PMC 1290.21]MDY7053266.1 hypothetical protein [Limnospira fusiformis LS22]